MTLTILRITLLRLWNNPLELLLIFVVPVLFFSLFAMIFSHGIATGTNKRVQVGVLDPSMSELTTDVVEALQQNDGVRCERILGVTEEKSVDTFVRNSQASNKYDLIVRLIQNEAEGDDAKPPTIALITDGQNPMALAIVQSILKGFALQEAARQSLLSMRSNSSSDSGIAGRSTITNPRVRRNPKLNRPGKSSISPKIHEVDEIFTISIPDLIPTSKPNAGSLRSTVPNGFDPTNDGLGMNRTNVESDIFRIAVQNPQSDHQQNPRVAMYAAGIAVLFLLFSATGNAATLLEEQEAGTLDRILASRAGLVHIVVGKWLGIFALGILQISVMFLWAELVFGIQLYDHIPGFCLMTATTAAATASFAMFLATLSKTRAQLSALSVLIILSMSALGGSMIPRFAMSDRMKEIGKWTFNAWAIDGYQKVFWYQLPIESLQDEIMVLCGSSLILGVLSYLLSSRWKTS